MADQFTIIGNLLLKVDNAEAGVNKLKNSLSKLKLPSNIDSDLKKSFSNLDGLFARYKAQLKDGFKTKGDVSAFTKTAKEINAEYDKITRKVNQLNNTNVTLSVKSDAIKEVEKTLNNLLDKKKQLGKDAKDTIGTDLNNIAKAGSRSTKAKDLSSQLGVALNKGDMQLALNLAEQLKTKMGELKTAQEGWAKTGSSLSLTQALDKVIEACRNGATGFDKLEKETAEAAQTLANLQAGDLETIDRILNESTGDWEKNTSAMKAASGEMQAYAQSAQSMSQQLGDLQQSTQYFFSLRNMISLFKRGIDDAIQSVKELDAAMTETAVVTDYKVSDLWGMLPQYTQLANQLGATTQGAYETMTLYFQQGLDQQQAFEIGAETMKMARIAGLDYAETTDMMTAALRGFNMELNETSAKRINDVYSELAAITASDTEELGTAMQRTASIAHSAGMSFEGTTAFLAQAIETTREPAENIGTAMKTIIARFQEMKKNPLEISEVDGEEVDYNKVDAALQSIGVSLKDTNGQFRELDQVFLDISSRWDSLSQTQQRYIATVAAGSRQQSRFIAMMDNYDRTVQLFEAANNSAGASDEQFGKTMDSLESKLNKLHNAWQAFTMGIANNGMIKLAVDGITGLLTVTNKLIDTFSLGIGPVKSLLSLLMAFTGLKAVGRIANSMIGGLGGLLDPQSSFSKGFKGGFVKNTDNKAQAQAISNPIVQAIHQLQQALTGKSGTTRNNNNVGDLNTFKESNNNLKAFLQGEGKHSFNVADAYGKISKLDDRQQASILGQLPGLTLSLKKNGIQFDTAGIKKESAELIQSFTSEINQGLKDNTISTQNAMQIFGTPENLKQALEARGPEYAKAASDVFFDQNYYQQQYDKYWSELDNADNYSGYLDSEEAIESRTKELQAQAKEKATIDAETKALEEFNQRAKVTQTSGAQIANSIGNIGTVAINAGQGIAQLGMQLSNAGFDIAGAAITNLGYQISSLGQIASSVGSIIGKISGAGGLGAIITAHPVIAGLTGAALALGGAFALVQHNIQKTKDAGEQVTKSFTETSKQTSDNIAKLKSYRGELASLSQGVDVNGNNVNLDDSQYQRYLEIVDDIAAINPDIVKGYSAQGHAIIDNNSALEDTLNLQQQIQKQTYKTYLSTDSLQTLINARNVNTDYGKAVNNLYSTKAQDAGLVANKTAPLTNDVRKLAKDLQFSAGFDESVLRKYGIESLDALIEGQEEAVNKFVKNQGKIQQELTNSGLEMGEDVLNSFQTLGEDTKAFDEAVKPVYDNLLASISNSSAYKDLAPEMQLAISEGLKGIAGQNLGANEMESAAKALMLNFEDAFNKAEDPLKRADEALNTFAQDLDEAAYNQTAEGIATELRNLAKEAEAVGQVEIAEWYENQASRVENAITEATYSIAEGVDTLADNIAKAKSSFEALAEGIDDYYTLSDQAKGLVDTALEDKNVGGNGSKTFWKTYQGLASEEAFNRHDKDEAVADMKQFQEYFAGGAEGARAFYETLRDSQEKSFKFTDNEGKEVPRTVSDFFKLAEDGTIELTKDFKSLSDEQYSQLAAAFKLSDDGFTTVLNNLRQWADIDFSDPELIRKALATDDRSITTDKEVSVEGQEGKVNRLYYGESALRAETAEMTESDREDLVNNLTVQGSIQLPSGAENLIKAGTKTDKEGKEIQDGSLLKQFVDDTKGTGNQMQNVMAALIKSGEYNKEDLGTIYQSIRDQNLLSGAADANKSFEDIYSAAELEVTDPATEAANEHLSTISGTVSTIAGIIGADKITEGYLPDAAKQSENLYNDLVGQLGKADTWAQLFSQGKDIENGGVITADKFTEYTNQLTEYGKKNDEYIAALKEGKENAKTPEETAAFEAEIEKAQRNADLIATLLQNAATSFSQLQVDFTNAAETTRNTLTKIGSDPDSTPDQQKTETANALTAFAGKLEKLNFNPEQIQTAFKENFGIDLKVEGGEFATDVGEQIKQQINDLGETQINAILNIASITMPAAAKGKNNTPSAIHRVGTMARGSRKYGYTINGEPTLTGELGPELVWEPRQNAAYMVGEHGPQFANLSKNAVVWNAEQTKRIKKNSKGVSSLGTGARGIHSFGTMNNGNAGGGGGKTLPGTFNIDANAMVQEVTPPVEMPTIPVKADLEVEGNTEQGLLGKIFGGKNNGPSINVAANVTSIKTNEQLQTVSVVGNVTQLKTNSSINNIDATATVTSVVKGSQVAGEPISVRAVATTTKVENKAPAQKVSAGSQSMSVTADTSKAQAKIKQLTNLFNKTYTLKYKASGPTSIKVPISANFTGSWKKTVEIHKSGANGINNQGFGSLANGSKYGTVGPRGSGGLTLTGEKGFEIAWLPSENRSLILGAKGPQMLNLPKDAVVFTNEQSKKILNQKAIPAGSYAGGINSASGKIDPSVFGYSSGSSSSGSKNHAKQIADNAKKTGDKVAQDVENTTKAIARVTVWWENHARMAEGIQRKMDQNQNEYQKYLKELRATLHETGTTGQGNAFIANNAAYIEEQQTQYQKAIRELTQIDTGIWQSGTKANTSATSKKKKKKKKNQVAYEQGADNILQISYEGKKKTKKGTKKVTKTSYVNTAGYIFWDEATGSYQIDQGKLNQIKNKSKRKQVADALNKEINDRTSKRNSAEDNIRKAQEALEKFAEELYNTFHSWEIELTRIWELTQLIERAQARVSRNEGFTDLFDVQISSGLRGLGNDTYNLDLALFRDKLTSQTDLLYQRQELLTENKQALTRLLNIDEDKETLQKVREKLASGTLDETKTLDYKEYEKQLLDRIGIAETAQKYTKITRFGDGTIQIDFDTEALEQARLNGDMTGDAAKAVQDWVKEAQELSNNISETIESLTADQAKFYNILRDLQKQISDYAQQLVDMSEQNEKKRIEQIRKLSDSVKKALDNLLKQVKDKLDERRKQEDNIKTEQDISQKQQRLAALRADTSSGHQVEIAQLEKEIAEAQQNYQRSLEDQLLDKLQQQNDLAAEQRERQIELQEQLASSVNNINEVNEWLADKESIQLHKDDIIQRYLDSKDFDLQPLKTQEELLREANSFYEDLLTNQQKQTEALANIASIESTLTQLDKFLRIQNSTLETAKINGLTAKEAQVNFGASPQALKSTGNYLAEDFVSSGLEKDLATAGFDITDAQKAGVTGVKDLFNAGYNASQIATVHNANDFFDADISYATAKGGFSRDDLLNSKYKPFVEQEIAQEELIRKQKQEQYESGLNKYWHENVMFAPIMSRLDPIYNKYKIQNREDYKRLLEESAALGYSQKQVISDLVAKEHGHWHDILPIILKSGQTDLLKLVSTFPDSADFQNEINHSGNSLGIDLDRYLHEAFLLRDHDFNNLIYDRTNGVVRDKFSRKSMPLFTYLLSLAQAKKITSYKTGGIADFTGPAWLDGTPSKPELVLNATDTKNFIALKDVLSRAMSSVGHVENSYGGNANFEININVDHISNDYDVNKVVDQVEKRIVQKSGYRNVTQVRNFR